MKDKETKTQSTGLSFGAVLTLIFIVLKLTGVITWAWVWVLSPVWISLILSIIVAVITLLIIRKF